MARLARIVAPHIPHFITQRGNRDLDVFFNENDARAYIGIMAEQCKRFDVSVWAYCLMKSRVHFLAVPADETGLGRAFGETHRRYTNRINEREGWTGHLWAARFSSFPLDKPYILPAAHFIEMMPVIEGLCKDAAAFKWSSARAHIRGRDDELCAAAPLLDQVENWRAFLQKGINIAQAQAITSHMRTGRPLGSAAFIEKLEQETGRSLKKKKPGRKPRKNMKPANHNRILHKRPALTAPVITEQVLAALIDSGAEKSL